MEKRHATKRPYYRDETSGWFSLMGVSFVVGAMLGATFALAWCM